MTLEELQAKVSAADAAVETAQRAGDADEIAKALDAADEAAADLRAAQAKARNVAGRLAERAAKASAGGAYQVGWLDLASGLSQIDPERIPAAGVVVFRDPAPAVRQKYEGKAQAAEAADDAGARAASMIDLICACTIAPEFAQGDPAALAYRRFWETTGRGLIHLAFMHIAKLGGLRADDLKSATR